MTSFKIQDWKSIDAQSQVWRKTNQKVVFTNGCFDILHLGHVDYLEKAAQLGDKLVLGLNADASVRRLKGESRPVNRQYARARVLAGLACIDAVVVFEQDTPLELIQKIRPDVLVKGGDYDISSIVGSDFVQTYGGKVQVIPFVEGYSTTSTIEKLKTDN